MRLLRSCLLLVNLGFLRSSSADKDAAVSSATTFNGLQVPPMTELTGSNFDTEVLQGNWFVEFYSPYCGHCLHMKPILQTAYEFYYTSNPVPGNSQTNSENLNSFSRFYDFKFAKIDCTAFGDTCSKKGAKGWPTFMMLKDGEEIKKQVGSLKIDPLSSFIEECLEIIRPGSRPKEGVKMPEVGADHSDDTIPEVSEEKDKNPAAGSAAASAHNALQTAESNEQAPLGEKPAPKRKEVNLDGVSVNLDYDKFQQMVTNSREAWFIKFYAPWCHHCQAMAPNWAQMAKEMKGQLNVGEVNCDIEKRLCKEARVKAFPTLLFFRGGERVEYDGLRGIGDLISYANKATEISEGVVDVDVAAFEKMEETEEVIFLYFYDHATTSEDMTALERLTLSLVGHAKLVKTQDKKLIERFGISTWPRLVVSRDTKPTYYTPLAPKDIRDVKKVLSWMKANWLPLVPELSSSNAMEVMEKRLVVLAVLSRENNDEFLSAKRELKNAAMEWIDKQTHIMQVERQELRDAKKLRIEEAEDRDDERALNNAKRIRIDMDEIKRVQVGFAWVDGVFWERWLRTTYGIDIKDGVKVIINDEDNRQYWDVTATGEPIHASRSSILETLHTITTTPSKISAKTTSSPIMRFFFRLRNAFTGHPYLMFGGITVSLLLGSVYSRRRRGFGDTGGFFNMNEKGGLLTGNSGGKTD